MSDATDLNFPITGPKRRKFFYVVIAFIFPIPASSFYNVSLQETIFEQILLCLIGVLFITVIAFYILYHSKNYAYTIDKDGFYQYKRCYEKIYWSDVEYCWPWHQTLLMDRWKLSSSYRFRIKEESRYKLYPRLGRFPRKDVNLLEPALDKNHKAFENYLKGQGIKLKGAYA